MPLALITLLIAILFIGAYRVYGLTLAKYFSLNAETKTPAEIHNDGCDYVPTSRSMLLAQHFASIAAAGPVVGPIAACLMFGWGPTILWILLGCTLIGACHDFTSLVASVRHDARSIPEIAKKFLGPTGYKLCLIFIWLCLIYVIIAFTDVTAQQFVARQDWAGVDHDIGGGVATSSILYLLLSVLMGIALTRWKVPLIPATLLFFPLLIGIIVLGQSIPITLPTANPIMVWSILIIAYCAIASVLPMWLLLQPRGYLGGYFLYVILAVGIVGLLFGGFHVDYPIFKSFFSPRGEPIYPFLFITVACGACSGFHGLVCSGTTSKQLQRETHATLVGYGGMLLEGVVAILAVATVMILPVDSPLLSRSPAEIYATGIAYFSHSVTGLDMRWGITFGMLAFATFVYDTLDVATRLGRYLVEELLPAQLQYKKFISTALTLGLPLLYVCAAPDLLVNGKPTPLWLGIWSLFGASNQLLAGLTLLLLSLWMRKQSRWPRWLLIPAGFMLVTSSIALLYQLIHAAKELRTGFALMPALNATIASLLLIVAVGFIGSCVRSARLVEKS